jgi:hypothetical protein
LNQNFEKNALETVSIHVVTNHTNTYCIVSKQDITDMMDLVENMQVLEKDQTTKDKLLDMIDALFKTYFLNEDKTRC